MPPLVPVDPSDPVVVVLALVLTEALKGLVSEKTYARFAPVLPLFVVLLAVFIRVVYDTVTSEGLSWSTMLRGLASAGVAVLTHAQFRAVAKALTDPAPPAEPRKPTRRPARKT